jgi:uncharacterized protein
MNTSDKPSLIEYPCDFPIKIIGRVDGLPVRSKAHPKKYGVLPPAGQDSSPAAGAMEYRRQDFIQAVLTTVKHYAPDFDEASMEFRISKRNTYLSLTCTIRAVSRAQLDALYQALCDQPMVVVVL